MGENFHQANKRSRNPNQTGEHQSEPNDQQNYLHHDIDCILDGGTLLNQPKALADACFCVAAQIVESRNQQFLILYEVVILGINLSLMMIPYCNDLLKNTVRQIDLIKLSLMRISIPLVSSWLVYFLIQDAQFKLNTISDFIEVFSQLSDRCSCFRKSEDLGKILVI